MSSLQPHPGSDADLIRAHNKSIKTLLKQTRRVLLENLILYTVNMADLENIRTTFSINRHMLYKEHYHLFFPLKGDRKNRRNDLAHMFLTEFALTLIYDFSNPSSDSKRTETTIFTLTTIPMLMFAFCRQSSIARIGRIAEHSTQKQQALVSTFSDSSSSVHYPADVHIERRSQNPFDSHYGSYRSSLDALFGTFEIQTPYLFEDFFYDEKKGRDLQVSDLTIPDEVQQQQGQQLNQNQQSCQQPDQQPEQHQQQQQRRIISNVDGQSTHDLTHNSGDVFTVEAVEENLEPQGCIAEQDNTTPLSTPFFEIYTYVYLLF